MTKQQGKINTIATPKFLRHIQIALMLATGFLLGAHVIKWDAIKVDGITIGLLGFLLIIPFAEMIKKIKLGEFEAEISKEEVAKAQAKASAELSPSSEVQGAKPETRIQELLREDPRLALAKVRIELEEVLKRLYSTTANSEPEWRRLSLGRIVDGLVKKEVINGSVGSALRDVITLANRAVHGEHVEPATAEELAVLGVRLTNELKQLHTERILRPVESVVVISKDVEKSRAAQYKVTTIIPLVENPTKNTYLLDQDSLDFFLEHYEEYAEFIIGIEQTE